MQTKSTNWVSLLTLVIIATSIVFLFLLVLLLAIASVMDLFNQNGDPAAGMISATAFGFVLLLLLACGWFVLQKVRGLESADLPFHFYFPPWLWAVLPPAVVLSILFGGLITLAELQWLNWLILPILTIIIIVAPIWLLFGIASKGIELGPRWQFFSIFSLSMTIAPVIMIVLELVVLVSIIVAGSVYIAMTQPALISELQAMTDLINDGMSEDAMLSMIVPYITNPLVLAAGIGYIAIIVPLIEELLKPLAVWLFARKLESPAQGFALGVLSGAAFALVESLNASADGTMTWAVIVSVRTGTSVLHMMTSGLVGWGIASAFGEKRIGRFFAAYISAFLIHGIWNAAAAGTGVATLGEMIGKPEWVFNFAPALVCGLLVLGIGVVALLVAANRKLRTQSNIQAISTQPEEVKVESST